MDLSITWLTAGNASLGTVPVKHYGNVTNGWLWVRITLAPPLGTTKAILTISASSLDATLYLDDLFLGNLLLNGGSETDANANTRPDNWTADVHVTRSSVMVHGGHYAMQHKASSAASYQVWQQVGGIVAGQRYSLVGWVNIPAPMHGSFDMDVVWLDGSGLLISSNLVAHYTGPSAWSRPAPIYTAPVGARSALIRLLATNLVGIVYVDDFALWP